MTKINVLGLLLAVVLGSTTVCAAESTDTSSVLPAEKNATSIDEFRPSLGLMIGTHIPNDSGIATRNLGIDFMYQPRIPFSFGLEAAYAEPESGATKEKMKQTTALAKAQYNFGGTIPVLRSSYVGVGAGVQVQDSDTKFAAAPSLGFDIPLRDENGVSHVSLGANARYLYVEGNEDVDTNGTSLNGIVKYWF